MKIKKIVPPKLPQLPTADVQYQTYRSERRYWQEAGEQAISFLSRSLVTLSSAGIGFTVAVIGDDLRDMSWIQFTPLCLSWISFLLSILLVHKSYHSTRQAARAYIDEEDYQYNGDEPKRDAARNERISADNKRVSFMNTAQYLFIVGIVMTLIFISVQISPR